jgi:hypothetical protein
MPRAKYIKLVEGVAITEKQRLKLVNRYIDKDISVTVEDDGDGNIRVIPMLYKEVILDKNGEKV